MERPSHPTGDKIVSLQILRFVAAAMVVSYHAWCSAFSELTGSCAVFAPAALGNAGVDIFFVLSGFVITMTGPLATRRPSGVVFFWRRWRRVAPVFYLISIPAIGFAVLRGDLNWPQTIGTLFFWPASGPQLVAPYLGAGWTLGFEMLFYSAVSAVLIGGRIRRNLLILAGVLAATFIARAFSGWNPLRILANPIFLEFAMGAGLAILWSRLRVAPLWLGLVLIATSVIGFAVAATIGLGNAYASMPTINGDGALHRAVVLGLPAACLVAGAAICDRWLSGPIVRFGAWMGDASYSIYLVRDLVMAFLTAGAILIVGHLPFLVAALSCIGSLAAGALAYVLIERPVIRDLKKLRL